MAIAVLARRRCSAAAAAVAAADGASDCDRQQQTPTVLVYDTPWTVYTSLDPGKEYWNNVYHYDVYETLTTVDPTAPDLVKPLLATSWESSEGGKVWTFHLRQGVKFHGGFPFTSADVMFSFDRNNKLAAGAYGFLYDGYPVIDAPDAVHRGDPFLQACAVARHLPPPATTRSSTRRQAFEKYGDKCFQPGTRDRWHRAVHPDRA